MASPSQRCRCSETVESVLLDGQSPNPRDPIASPVRQSAEKSRLVLHTPDRARKAARLRELIPR